METTRINGISLVPGAAKGRYCSGADTASSTRRKTLILLIDHLDISTLKELRPKLKGLVVTRAGLLSHTAIFARELSLPLLLVESAPALADGASVCFGDPGDTRPIPNQVTTADGIEAWKAALEGAQFPVEYHLYENLNHLLMTQEGSVTRTLMDYALPGHVSQQVIEVIAAFILAGE